MELLNATEMVAGYTLGMDPDGRERVVVAVKGTFRIPPQNAPDREPELADEQVELVMADEFTGEPGFSATLYESDFAAAKPECDVVVVGRAHAPNGRPAYQVTVGLRVGPISKFFDVVGDRVWTRGAMGPVPGEYQPFTTMPVSYDRAWGGMDEDPDDPDRAEAFRPNPVGVGFYPVAGEEQLLGRPLPNTQEQGDPIDRRTGSYRPMALGPIGRHFESRIAYAGTYDDAWLEDGFPFLPDDFDPLYFQCAPADQRMPYPEGGEWVELTGLTPAGRAVFRLPSVEVPVEFTDRDFEREETAAVADTIVIEPDEGRFSVVWRASRPLKENIFEVTQCVVGRMPRGWYRARELGKEYYPSLGEMVAARREGVS